MGRSIQEVMPSASVVSNAFQPPLDQTLTRRPATGLPVSWSMSLEAPGTGHAVAVRGKGGSARGGREDVADEYRPRAVDHHIAVRPDTTQRHRRQAVDEYRRRNG